VLDLTQPPGSVLNAYGWACLIFLVVTMGEAIRNELSGRARDYGWVSRVGAWMYPLVCLLIATIAWYLAAMLQ
jgi:hypothetical protein